MGRDIEKFWKPGGNHEETAIIEFNLEAIIYIQRGKYIVDMLANLAFNFSTKMGWMEEGSIQIMNIDFKEKYYNDS